MTQTRERKAKIQPIHKEEAAALKRLFETHAKMSQAAFAAEHGLKSQGNLWQYLNAKIPLNANAAALFAKGLGVSVRDFSPRLAEEIDRLGAALPGEEESEHAPVRLMVDVVVEAGKGRPVYSEDETKTLMFRRDWLHRHGIKKEEDAACVEVRGRSMVDAGIPDESIVIVNLRQTEPLSKKIYAVHTEKGPIIKQLVKENGRWIARSRNEEEKDEHPDIPVGPEARVIGRAFWCGFSL